MTIIDSMLARDRRYLGLDAESARNVGGAISRRLMN
jgi:hypothetical protein